MLFLSKYLYIAFSPRDSTQLGQPAPDRCDVGFCVKSPCSVQVIITLV